MNPSGRSRVCLESRRVRSADARRPGEAANLGHALSRLHERRHPLARREPVLRRADGDRTDALARHRRLADRSAGDHDSGREEAGNPRVSGKTRRSRLGLDSHRSLAARGKLPQDRGVDRQRAVHRHQVLRRQSRRRRLQPSRQRRDHPPGRGAEGGDLHSHLDEGRRAAAAARRRQRARRIDADGRGAAGRAIPRRAA